MDETGVLFRIGPLEVTGVAVTMLIIVGVILLVAYIATRKLSDVPGVLQNAMELAIEKLESFFSEVMGRGLTRRHFGLFATLFIFIIVSNYAGILPGAGHYKAFKVPTADLSVTAGLALVAFFASHTIGVRELGARKYFGSFLKPIFFLLPLNIVEQLVRPFSLAMRLYGNIFGEETVLENLYDVFPILLPLLMNVLSLLFCYIQAVVFCMLLGIYVSEGTEIEEK